MTQFLVSILIGLMVFSGCADTSEDGQESESTAQVEESSEETTENASSSDEEVSEDDFSPASADEIEHSETVSDFSSYEELSQQDFFNPTDFDAHLVTDNPGTRVFIFQDADQQAYKTVFIKETQRLKVIDLANNELLMNEPLD